MSSMSPQVPRSAASNYGDIVMAVTIIAVSVILFRKLRETGDKSGDEGHLGILVPSQAPPPTTSELKIINQNARDEPNPGISNSAQVSTTPRPHENMRSGEVASITLFQGSSNFQISDTIATVILNGDGQFTKIQRNLICDYIANLPDINDNLNLKEHVLTQSITNLPRAIAGYNQTKKSRPCFKSTRVGLLREMADCVTGSSESRIYILSGLAGIGKSTIAYTIASRAADLNLLGASFFFSRDEADRNNAKRFFTTIAHQLCVYDEAFAKAIEGVLKTTSESVTTTLNIQLQLKLFILDPLRSIVQSRSRPTTIVVDALDECDEEDAFSVLDGLCELVCDLPSFKVILTTRPQPYLNSFLGNQGDKKFHLQDIQDKVVDGDIWVYLSYCLSMDQVQRHYPKRQWCASDKEIDYLVRAAGRLFIIASTAVRYILDKSASNPAAQIQKLLRATAQDHTPFKNLDRFYTVILRNVVPEDCGDDDIVSCYQSVVGTIIFVQHPLPVSTLAHLIGIDVKKIRTVLDKLQSVIFLGDDDVPRVYHKSFPEFLMDKARCEVPHLQIDPRIRHTQIATRCFKIMCEHLKYNILGFGDLARFMSNEDGLKEDGIADEQLEERIPPHLHYACVYWSNHLEVANTEDTDLVNALEKFLAKHLLHWFEVLSLIGKLESAQLTILAALKFLKSSSDLYQLLSDALCFIGKFYEIIKRSALHAYYSALPFTPMDSLLYRRYIKEAMHNICTIEGGPEKWDALIANLSHGQQVDVIKFSRDSTLFVPYSINHVRSGIQGKLKIWDVATGTPISTIPGDKLAVGNDFSTVASSQDNITTLYNVNGNPCGIMFTTPSEIQQLALSSESNRVAAALADGTVWLWDSRNAELIDSFESVDGSEDSFKSFDGDSFGSSDGSEDSFKSFDAEESFASHDTEASFTSHGAEASFTSHSAEASFKSLDGSEDSANQLIFSSTGTRLAYSSANVIKLRDGISGRVIADLQCGSSDRFEFSGDGSRFASLSKDCGLTLWDSEGGGLVAAASCVGRDGLAISGNGSLLATANQTKVTLWTENNGFLAQIKVLAVRHAESMVFSFSSDNILAIASNSRINLYNVKTYSLIHTLPLGGDPTALAFSPDCTRLAVGDSHGNVNIWDIRGINACGAPLKKAKRVTALALSRDCSRLACGFEGGAVELWGTNPTKRRIASYRAHKKLILALGFGPDGGLFASGSDDRTIKLWNGKDGLLCGTLKVPSGMGAVVALSNTVMVAAGDGGVTLWSLETLSLIHTFTESSYGTSTVSIAENSALIAVAHLDGISLLDAENYRTFTRFKGFGRIHTMTFLHDNLQLVAQSKDGVFLLFNLINKHVMKGATLEYLVKLPNISLWCGVPIWHCLDKEQHYFQASFSQHKSPVSVLWIPRHIPVAAWTQGSSMIALGCWDGSVILVRLPAMSADRYYTSI